jgi:CHAT domain-containing protein/tetratricopeptide (TPR) repeat protein
VSRLAPDRWELLLELRRLQQQAATSWARATAARLSGRLPAAQRAYDEYITATRKFLDLGAVFNQGNPHPFALEPVAQPLAAALLVQADIATTLGHPQAAAPLRTQAAAVVARFLGAAETADYQRQQASVLAIEGRFNQALVALATAREMFAVQGNVLGVAQTSLDLAVVLGWLGDHARALDAVHRAAEVVEPQLAGGPGPTLGGIAHSLLGDLAGILAGQGNPEQAEQQTALWRIAVEIREHEARARKETGDLDEAERLFRSVLPRYRQLRVAEAIEYQLAAIDLQRGRHHQALATLQRIAPAFEHPPFRPRRAALRMLQADALLALGQPAVALEQVEDGRADQDRFPDLDLDWKLGWRRGRALAALGRQADALAAYVDAAGQVDMLRKAPLGYRLDSTYLDNKLTLFEGAVDLAARTGAAADGCRLIELVKARALATVLSIPADRRGAVDPLEHEFDRVTERLDALEYAMYAGNSGVEQRAERGRMLARRVELAEQIRVADPRWRSLSAPAAFDLDATLAALATRDQAGLTLLDRGEDVVGVLLYAGQVRIAAQPVAAGVRHSLNDYAENLQRGEHELDPFLLDLSEERDVTADQLVPRPLLEAAVTASSLVMVPHRTLHLLPWAGLTLDGMRLFERTAVGVLPNLSCLRLLDADFTTSPGLALFGAPSYVGLRHLGDMPAAVSELDALAREHAGRLLTPPVTGEHATERAFWRLASTMPAGAVLHVACHGTLDRDEPMLSGLLLSDAKIDAGEIVLRRLGCDEVVLGACSSGWRPQEVDGLPLRGDDILGLCGALLEAGVRFVLVSIPKADDAVTRKFMLRFHRERAAGAGPLAAVRATQLALLAAGAHPPSQWIGLAAYGCR